MNIPKVLWYATLLFLAFIGLLMVYSKHYWGVELTFWEDVMAAGLLYGALLLAIFSRLAEWIIKQAMKDTPIA